MVIFVGYTGPAEPWMSGGWGGNRPPIHSKPDRYQSKLTVCRTEIYMPNLIDIITASQNTTIFGKMSKTYGILAF